MSKIFVTGASGFIGSHLAAKLADLGHEVTNYDLMPPALPSNVKNIRGSILDVERLAQHIKGHDTVFHLAAMVGVVRCLAHPQEVMDVNYTGTINVAKAAHLAGVDNFLFASSSEVYGEGGSKLLRETMPPAPKSTYGKAKLASEAYLMQFAQHTGMKVTALRYCNIYGPRQKTEFVIPLFIKRALLGEPLTVCDQGQQSRCYTYVADAVMGTIAALQRPQHQYEIYNICSSHSVTVLEAAEQILALCADGGDIVFTPYEALKRDAKVEIILRTPSPEKALRDFGFYAQTPFAKGLENTYAYYEAALSHQAQSS